VGIEDIQTFNLSERGYNGISGRPILLATCQDERHGLLFEE